MNGRISLAVLALCASVACGPSGASFIGTWTVSTGSFAYTCDAVPGSLNDTGDFVIAASSNGNIVSIDSTGCNLQWTPSGNTASLVPGQSCAGTVNGVTYDWTFNNGGTVTLTNGTTLSATASGSGTADGATCTFTNTVNGTLVTH